MGGRLAEKLHTKRRKVKLNNKENNNAYIHFDHTALRKCKSNSEAPVIHIGRMLTCVLRHFVGLFYLNRDIQIQ